MENSLIILILLIPVISVNYAKLPEVDLSTPELIQYWGYPVEVHEALTKDGYYLTLHRIPYGRQNSTTPPVHEKKERPVFFLQHGLLDSSAAWVLNLRNESLGFILADAGFDVWMGNIRGNTYSKKHVSHNVSSSKFWDFCFDDMSKYDFPAMIDYILNKTNKKQMYYVGYSQGSIMAFAGLSEQKELQTKIKVNFALAPVTRILHIGSTLKRLASYQSLFKWTLKLFGINELLPSTKAMKHLNNLLCSVSTILCEIFISMIAGFDTKNLNETRLPVYLSHMPAGTSTKNALHYMQLVNSKMFRKYDYGLVWNLKKYHTTTPPKYNFDTVNTPTVIISGSHDWLSTPEDVKWTAEHLPNVVKKIEIPGYNHIDFVWAKSARKEIYEKIIKIAHHFK